MLPALAIGGGLLQGALGFFGAKKKAAQLAAQEKQNRNANVMNQAWSGMLGNKAQMQEDFEKPSALAGALQGGLAGAMQGVNVYKGLKELNAKKLMGGVASGAGGAMNNIPTGPDMMTVG